MKVLVTPRSFGKTDPYAFEILRNAGLEIIVNDTGGIMDKAALAKALADCDGVVLGVDPCDRSVLVQAPKLKAIARYGVGIDNVDVEECKKRGIAVSLTVGANSDAVADFAFALMMAVARRVVETDSRCRKRDWSKLSGIDIYGKTLGLVGLGAIGKGMAARASGFGMRILACDVFWDDAYAAKAGVVKATLDRICAEADFISLHVPLTDETRGMIGKDELARMKKTVVIINTARGGVIDEPALLNALKSKAIYGAGIDAFEAEPPKTDAWFALDNIIIGSHSAASTVGAAEKMGRMAAKNLIRDLCKE